MAVEPLPSDPSAAYYRTRNTVDKLQRQLRDLDKAEGWREWRGTPVGDASHRLEKRKAGAERVSGPGPPCRTSGTPPPAPAGGQGRRARRTLAGAATKTGKARWVDLPRQLCDELAAHLAARDHDPETRVWSGERGGPPAHKWFYTHRFKPVVEEWSARGELPTIERPAGVDGDAGAFTLRFHDLRHRCVALLIAKGAQQYEVMEHLGHTNIQITINTYGHLFPNVRERIRVALEDTWDEGRRSAG